MVSGGTVSLFEMHQGSVEARSASQAATVETMQSENAKLVEAENRVAVQTEKMTFYVECQAAQIHNI